VKTETQMRLPGVEEPMLRIEATAASGVILAGIKHELNNAVAALAEAEVLLDQLISKEAEIKQMVASISTGMPEAECMARINKAEKSCDQMALQLMLYYNMVHNRIGVTNPLCGLLEAPMKRLRDDYKAVMKAHCL